MAEMYSLGYVQVEDMYSFVEPDSLDFAEVELDADVYYDYYNYILRILRIMKKTLIFGLLLSSSSGHGTA